MQRAILFQSADVTLVSVGLPSVGPVFVTFYYWEPPTIPGADGVKNGLGFSEKFLTDLGIPSLHFISHKNHWWQTGAMAEALMAANSVIASSQRRIGYGSSMGGYGVIRFAKSLNLDTVLAFVPQYSISPKIVPWETRFAHDLSDPDLDEGRILIGPDCQIIAFYDPDNLDKDHVDLIAAEVSLCRVPMPGAGHKVYRALRDMKALPDLVLGVFRGNLGAENIAGFVDNCRAKMLNGGPAASSDRLAPRVPDQKPV